MFDVILTDNFQYQSQFLRMRVTNWPNIFVNQGQFSDTDLISATHQRENVQYVDKLYLNQSEINTLYGTKLLANLCRIYIQITHALLTCITVHIKTNWFLWIYWQKILENKLKGKLLTEPVSKEVEAYVLQCIDLVWYMCIQQPPMEIMWAKPGEKFNKEVFLFSGKKGKKFKTTVWPAVFLHKEGPLVVPGYAVSE